MRSRADTDGYGQQIRTDTPVCRASPLGTASACPSLRTPIRHGRPLARWPGRRFGRLSVKCLKPRRPRPRACARRTLPRGSGARRAAAVSVCRCRACRSCSSCRVPPQPLSRPLPGSMSHRHSKRRWSTWRWPPAASAAQPLAPPANRPCRPRLPTRPGRLNLPPLTAKPKPALEPGDHAQGFLRADEACAADAVAAAGIIIVGSPRWCKRRPALGGLPPPLYKYKRVRNRHVGRVGCPPFCLRSESCVVAL